VKKGLRGVGLLSSSDFPSLQPGYLVVFDGIYATQPEAVARIMSLARMDRWGRKRGIMGVFLR